MLPVARVPFSSLKLPGSNDRGVLTAQSSSCIGNFSPPNRASLIPIKSDLITPPLPPSLQDKVQAPQPGMKKSSLQPYCPAVPATRAMPHAPNRQRYGLMSPLASLLMPAPSCPLEPLSPSKDQHPPHSFMPQTCRPTSYIPGTNEATGIPGGLEADAIPTPKAVVTNRQL